MLYYNKLLLVDLFSYPQYLEKIKLSKVNKIFLLFWGKSLGQLNVFLGLFSLCKESFIYHRTTVFFTSQNYSWWDTIADDSLFGYTT